MKSMRILIYFILFAIIFTETKAQVGNPGQNPYKAFNPVPASPNIASFEKYGNIPVNINTGIPSIQIPITEISFSDFSWPVSMSYHASGFKSEDIASRQGLGWNLTANGVISSNQTALNSRGSNLELKRYLNLQFSNGGFGECLPVNETDINLADGIASGIYATEPVVFNLNSATLSAKFLPDGNCLPAKNIKITHQGDVGTPNVNWTIKDESGNTYEFYLNGSNSRSADCQGLVNAPENLHSYLTKITTVNGNIINFIYSAESYTYQLPPTLVKKFNPDYQSYCNARFPNEEYSCENTFNANEYKLDRIEASNGIVIEFSYSGREDISGSTKLDRILIHYQQSGILQQRKVFDLEYGYFLTEPYNTHPVQKQLKLNVIKVKGEDNTSLLNQYSFVYNNAPLPNKLSSSISFPNGSYTNAIYNISQAGILERINYPTGGYTTFTYEVIQAYGTLRLKELKDFNFDNVLANSKSYDYNDTPPLVIQAVFTESEPNYFFGNPNGTDPNFCIDVNPCSSPSIWLQRCDRFVFRNTPVKNTYQDYTDNSVKYPFVSEFNGLNGINGKTEYLYGLPMGNRSYNDVFYLEQNLIEKRIYKKQNSTDYVLISKVKYNYETSISSNNFFDNSEIPLESRYWVKRIKIERPELILTCCSGLPPTCFEKLYLESDYRIASVPVYLKSTEEQSIEEGNSITRVTTYSYNNPNWLNPTSKQFVNSKNEIIVDEYKYSYDFNTNAVNAQMTDKNMISQVIEIARKNISKGIELNRTQTEYGFWHGGSKIFINKQKESIAGSTFQDLIVFEKYSTIGNAEQYLLKDGLRLVVLWGYSGILPVAKIIGSDYNTVLNNTGIDNSMLNSPSNDNALRIELNKLRFLPQVFVETYTYKPLFGKTSETDFNGRTTYYEFDVFGRLIRIRDKDNRIRKVFDYKFKDQ